MQRESIHDIPLFVREQFMGCTSNPHIGQLPIFSDNITQDELYLLHQYQQQTQTTSTGQPATPASDWRETLPGCFPAIAAFARRPFVEQLALVTLSAAVGAYVLGILFPIIHEISNGKLAGIPYPFWGVTLWLVCASFYTRRQWLAFGWFAFVFFLVASWV